MIPPIPSAGPVAVPQTPEQAKPRPLGTIAAILGVVAAIVGLIAPAIAFVVPGAFGATAVALSIYAGGRDREGKPSVLGLLGGVIGLALAAMLYGQYDDAMNQLNQIQGMFG